MAKNTIKTVKIMLENTVKKSTKKSSKIVTANIVLNLKARAIETLKLMAEYNYVSQLNLIGFLGNRNTVWEKLHELELASLVISFSTGFTPSKCYCLTPRGYNFLEDHNLSRIGRRWFSVSGFCDTTLRHTLACVDVQLRLKEHPQVVDYFSTKVLNANKTEIPPLQPDAELLFKTSAVEGTKLRRAAVEIEITQKSFNRNLGRVRRYAARADLDLVLWVCGSDSIKRTMQNIVKKHDVQNAEKYRFVLFNPLVKNGVEEVVARDVYNDARHMMFELVERRFS